MFVDARFTLNCQLLNDHFCSAGPDQCNSANAIFCSWMAVGNILGFSAGASGNWHKYVLFFYVWSSVLA